MKKQEFIKLEPTILIDNGFEETQKNVFFRKSDGCVFVYDEKTQKWTYKDRKGNVLVNIEYKHTANMVLSYADYLILIDKEYAKDLLCGLRMRKS